MYWLLCRMQHVLHDAAREYQCRGGQDATRGAIWRVERRASRHRPMATGSGTMRSRCTAPCEHSGSDDDRGANHGWQEPERQRREPVPQGQVWAVVHVEGCEHGDVANAHTKYVRSIAGPVVATVHVSDRRCCERHSADDQQVVVLPPPHDRQGCRGEEYDCDRAVEPSASPDVPRAALSRQGCDCSRYHGGKATHDVNSQERQENRGDGAHLVAENAGREEHLPGLPG